MYLQLIKLLLNKKNYNKYNKLLYRIFKDNKHYYILYTLLGSLHAKYCREEYSVEEYSLYVLTHCYEKDREVLQGILSATSDDSSVVLEDVLRELTEKSLAYDLAMTAIEVSEGRKPFSDLLISVSELNAAKSDAGALEEVFVTNDLELLADDYHQKKGLRWRLTILNRMLGSLRKGNFGFLFARPETGKTTFLASEVTNFATQTTSPILWLNNEEAGNQVQLRIYQAFFGITREELFARPNEYKNRYLSEGGQNLKVVDNANIHRGQVEALCEQYQPALVVIDQIDKIKGFTNDREDLRLGAVYIWAREIAKKYCPVIGVCQADVSGEGKRWLTMENVANAKTAKQAEADWILGLGKTHSATEEYMRHLHLSKNKLSGDIDTDPAMRHGRETVLIKPEIARYEDL